MTRPMDTIHIRDLRLRCIVGIRPEERHRKRALLVNVALQCDLRGAGRRDRIEATVDYSRLADDIVTRLDKSRFFLIEKVAEEIAGLCLRDRRVAAATVTVDKPGALRRARSVAVDIRRVRRRGPPGRRPR